MKEILVAILSAAFVLAQDNGQINSSGSRQSAPKGSGTSKEKLPAKGKKRSPAKRQENADGALDPHENPFLNGAAAQPPKPAAPDPHAVADPIPVRAPNLAVHIPEQRSDEPLSDTQLTEKIRTMLLSDNATARYAGEIRIISHAGMVTIEGILPSAEARHEIEQKVIAAAGQGKVTNHLEIRP